MLSVSPQEISAFEARYRAAQRDRYIDDHEEAILNSDRDLAPRGESSSSSSSSSVHTPTFSRVNDSEASSALLIRSKHQGWERSFELHHDWVIPPIEEEDEVLIRNVSVGLNPVDFKSILYNFGISDTPWVLGRDIAGVIEKLGNKVSRWKEGDRVWLCADSRDVRSGAYQAYSIARQCHLGRLSDNVKDEEAATLGTGLITAAIAAYWFFRWQRAGSLGGNYMPRMSDMDHDGEANEARRGDYVLIYGGGSITGIYLTQLARLSGLRVISIASPTNFDYLKSLGATYCLDRYLEPEELQEEVASIVQDEGVRYCIDTVGSKTATTCHGILQSSGISTGEMICLAGDPKLKSINSHHDRPAKMRRTAMNAKTAVESPKRDVTVHKISFSTTFYGDDVFAEAVMADMDALLSSGELHPARAEVWPDGLAGVRRGLEALRDNKGPRASKLVVNIADTPDVSLTNLGVRAELGWNGAA